MKDFSEYRGAMWLLANNPECYTIPIEGYTLYAYDTLEECENVIASTKIMGELGLPVQDVELGVYRGRAVVAARDFMKDAERFMTLRSLLYLVGKASDDIEDVENLLSKLKYKNKDSIIEWFYNLLVADGLLGYNGRTLDNIGVLYNVNTHCIRVCPMLGGNTGMYLSSSEGAMRRLTDNRSLVKLRTLNSGCSKLRFGATSIMFWDLVKYCKLSRFRTSINAVKASVEFEDVYKSIDSIGIESSVKIKLIKECFYVRYHMLFDPDRQY